VTEQHTSQSDNLGGWGYNLTLSIYFVLCEAASLSFLDYSKKQKSV